MPIAQLPGDLQMHYEVDDFTDPWAESETVILHHGNGKNLKFWRPWVPLLARDFRVVRLDARGFGGSSVPEPGYAWSLEGFADDLRNLMDELGIAKAHLVGESVGGTIGLQFAQRYPERLYSLTTCTSPYTFRGKQNYLDGHKLISEQGVEAWVRNTSDSRLESGKSDHAHSEWYIREMCRTPKHVLLETLQYLSNVDLGDVLRQIRVPTMIMVGEHSSTNIPDRAQNMVALIPNGRLMVVPGASGFVQHSVPEQCVALWREFAAELGHPGQRRGA